MDNIKKRNYIFTMGDTVALSMFKKSVWVALGMFIVLILSILVGMRLGSVPVSWADVMLVLQGQVTVSDATETIWDFRFPRLMGSMIAGMAMALSGYMLQIIAQNALADPGVLGLSSGAVLCAVVAVFIVPNIPPTYMTTITFLGAIVTGLLVYIVANGKIQGAFVVLVGIAVSAVIGAVMDIIFSVMEFENMVATMAMIAGDFSYITLGNSLFLGVWFLGCFTIFMGISRYINPMSLGVAQASFLGIKVRVVILVLLALSILAMAPVIALAGAIGFVGLVATFLTKNLIGYRGTELGVVSMMLGGIMTVWADTLGRTLFAPIMVHAGVFISVIGGGFFVLFVYMGRR